MFSFIICCFYKLNNLNKYSQFQQIRQKFPGNVEILWEKHVCYTAGDPHKFMKKYT